MRFRNIALVAAVAACGVVAWTNTASAVGNCSANGNATTYASSCSGNTVKAGSEVASAATLRAAATQTGGLISQRISSIAAPAATRLASTPNENGIAGGDKDYGIGFWANGGLTSISVNDPGANFGGRTATAMSGVDYRVTNDVIVGVAGGYEYSPLRTYFNNGKLTGSGATVAPYAVYMFNKNYSVDITGGYSWLNYTMLRKDPLTNNSITSKTNAGRSFGAIDLNGNWAEDAWRFGARAGTVVANEKKNAFTESDGTAVASRSTTVGQILAGGRVGYNILDVVEPFGRVTYRHNYGAGGGGNDVVVGGGTDLFIGSLMIGSLEYSDAFGQARRSERTVNGTVRFQF